MKSRLVIALSAVAGLGAVACGGGGSDVSEGGNPQTPPAAGAWRIPDCTSVSGQPGITFTSDDGATRAPGAGPVAPGTVILGLVALTTPNTLLTVVGSPGSSAKFLFSSDAGCTWRTTGQVTADPIYERATLTAAGAMAYFWAEQTNSLYQVPAEGAVTQLSATFNFYGLGVDENDPLRIRAAGLAPHCRASCGGSTIRSSTDAGWSWSLAESQSPYPFFNVYFSPASLDHMIATGAFDGAQVSFDGGKQWVISQGLDAEGEPIGYEAEVGPDGQTVWLLVDDPLADNDPTTSRSVLLLSRDGGVSFERAVTADDEHPFSAAETRLFTHPSDPDVVYFSYADAGEGRSYLYRYDAGADELGWQAWPYSEGRVSALAFSPADSRYLYLGLARD